VDHARKFRWPHRSHLLFIRFVGMNGRRDLRRKSIRPTLPDLVAPGVTCFPVTIALVGYKWLSVIDTAKPGKPGPRRAPTVVGLHFGASLRRGHTALQWSRDVGIAGCRARFSSVIGVMTTQMGRRAFVMLSRRPLASATCSWTLKPARRTTLRRDTGEGTRHLRRAHRDHCSALDGSAQDKERGR
jgi:hypothetical protein